MADGFTNADRDHAAQVASKSAADQQMAELIEQFHSSPEQRLARDRAEIERLQNDPYFMNKRVAGDAGAEAQETALQARIAIAEAEVAKLHGPNRIEHALTTDPATDPLSDSTDGSASELPMRALRSQIEEFRSLGLTDAGINAAVNGGKETRASIADAKWIYDELMADEMWVAKLTAGNREARKQLALLSIVMNATPTD
jgi:hypothetical protein